MFRPFPWEAKNPIALVSSVEGLALAGLLLWSVPGLFLDRGQMFTRGLTLHAGAFISIFVFLFSAIGNFGILSRQRAQVMPFIFIFIAIGLGVGRIRGSADRKMISAASPDPFPAHVPSGHGPLGPLGERRLTQ